jgi:hypothetical protein
MGTVDIYLDIETLPADARPGIVPGTPPGWEPIPFLLPQRKSPPANYRKPEAIAEWEAAEDDRHAAAIEEARDRHADREADERAKAWDAWHARGLSPMLGRVLCVGFAIADGPVATIVDERDGDGEAEVLAELLEHIRDVTHGGRLPHRIIGHNIAGFDAPFLAVRGARHGIALARWLRSPSGKPWDAPLLDTADAWPCRSRPGRGQVGGSGKLPDIAAFLGLPPDPNPIDGSQVCEAYLTGRLHDVVQHCRHDIAALRDVHLRLVALGMM